ncbi:hypothetical protein VPH35_112155 [Triticum aestivum]
MASSGSRTRLACADQEDMPKTWMEAGLDKEKEKDVPTPPCWCGDVCKLKVSTDRKKSWTEGRRFFVCPNYAHDRRRPTNAYDIPPSPPPLCKYFTWIDHEVPKVVQEDRDYLRRQRLFEESFARGLEHERREREKNERKKREQERAHKEKEARQEERARKLARAHDAQEEDEARDKKGKWPRTTQ